MEFQPHPYQSKMIDHILSRPYCLLAADMGLGKTVTTATALAQLFDECMIRRVLIVAPKRVALHVWAQELEKWDHLRGRMSCTVLSGRSKADRHRASRNAAQIHVINYELLWKLITSHTEASWPYDCLVFDESSRVKNRATTVHRAARHARKKASRVIELSATPTPNGLLDLWPQVYLLDQGKRLGKTLTAYRTRWFTCIDAEFNTWVLRKGASKEIHEAVADIMISLSADDYLNLPGRMDNLIEVDIPPAARKVYQELEDQAFTELAEDETVTAASAAAVVSKLLQVSNGAVYHETEDGTRVTTELHTAKLEALQEIIDGATSPVLVGYSFQSDLIRIQKAIPQAQALTHAPDLIAQWNRGDIPVLCAHPASAGHGLNLQDGGHTLVWFGLPWSLELYQQFTGRLDRQGQTQPVMVHHLLARDTFDHDVLRALQGKTTVQQALLDAVRLQIAVA